MERMQGHYENQAQSLKYQMKIRNIVMGKKLNPRFHIIAQSSLPKI